MEDFRTQLKKLTSDIHLSVTEKERMREQLVSYMEYRPIRNRLSSPPSRFFLFSARELRFAMPALLVALVFVSGGVSFAAERAVPGTALYPIKVHVNEEVRSALAFDEETKLSWDIRRAERRLEEAAALVAEGDMDAQAHAALRTQFEKHTEAVAARVEAVEEENPTLALEANSEFEASLMAHGEVIERLAEAERGSDEPVEELLAKVDEVVISLSDTVAIASDAAMGASMEMMTLKAPGFGSPEQEGTPSENIPTSSDPSSRIMALREEDQATPLTQEDAAALEDDAKTTAETTVDMSHKSIAQRMEKLVREKLERSEGLLERYGSDINDRDAAVVEDLLSEIERRADDAHELIEREHFEEAFRDYKQLLLVVLRTEVYIRTAGELDAPSIPLPTLDVQLRGVPDQINPSTTTLPLEEDGDALIEPSDSSSNNSNSIEIHEQSVDGSSSVDIHIATSTESGSAEVRVNVQIDTAL